MEFFRESIFLRTIFAFALVLMTISILGEAQQIQSCASKLVNCSGFLNSTGPTPTSSCCDPLKEAITNDSSCLCDLYKDPSLLRSFGVNVTEAILLPTRCNIAGSTDMCNKTSTPAMKTPPSSPSPPNTGTNGAGKPHRITMTGVLSLVMVLMPLLLF